MDQVLQTLPHTTAADAKYSPPNQSSTPPPPSNSGTPERLKVSKPFKYPERYTSPTDQIMSPVSRGILARGGRKSTMLLPPSANHHKIEALKFQESDLPN